MHVQKPSVVDVTPEGLIRSNMVCALLGELTAKLEILADDDSPGHIDLSRLPLPPGTMEALRAWLGDGEAEATVTSLALTTIRETGVAGVWWVRQARSSGETLSEHLEISRSPALLSVHPDEVKRAAEDLRRRLSVSQSHASPANP